MTLNRDEILAVKTYAASLGPAAFRLGEELRPDLDGGVGPFRYALSPHELEELNRQDPDLWGEACRKSRTDLPPCTSGMHRFHIDAYGGLQLCSGNRRQSYDLRRGSFREGFYDALPAFACEWKAPAPAPLMQRKRIMSETRPLAMIPYGTFSQRAHARAAASHQVIKAQLELTYRCNLHCRHCYTDPYNDSAYFPRELTLVEIHRLLGDMRELGIVWLNLTGGDIFMRPDFFDIYETAIGHGFLLQLYTNGTLFTRAIVERLQTHPPFSIDIPAIPSKNRNSTGSRKCQGPIARSSVESSCCRPPACPFR